MLAGLDSDGLRTDLIMVASLNTQSMETDILLIPDNTKMNVGGRNQKISAAYALTSNGEKKQISGTIDAVNRLTHIPINYYIVFSSDDFIHLIDRLGGVEFDVPDNMKYSDAKQDLYIDLKKGYQLLDGKNTYNLLQYASYENGVQERSQTQLKLLDAFSDQKLNKEHIAKLPHIFSEIDIKTNLTAKDVIKYSEILLNMNADNVSFIQCPGYQSGENVTYWIPDTESLKNIVENNFGYSPAKK